MVTDVFLRMNSQRQFRNYPVLAYLAFQEAPENLGCQMGGLLHFSIDGSGNVERLVFLPVTFGNIREEALSDIFARMRRAVPFPSRQGCPASFLNPVLREKHAQTGNYPIPYSEIKGDWEKMFSVES